MLTTAFCVSLVLFCHSCFAGEPAVPEGATPGESFVWQVEGESFPLRWCPAGEFLMGSPETEQDRDPGEVQHRVVLTRGYWILETEVTQQTYQKVVGNNPSSFRGETNPVDTVSWDDAVMFCRQLSDATGCRVLLPTEAQWEYAARAGTTGPWAGDLQSLAWFGEVTEEGSTHPVGTKTPNAWGICDMHGNLWEWTRDRWSDFTTETVTDPVGPTSSLGDVRVDRGGCWDSSPEYCRSAHRGVYEANRSSRFVGFRFVVEP